MGKMVLDPNAASYTDDQIVGKVNAATDKVSADKVEDGTTNKVYTGTEKTKLTGIATGADVNPTDDEVIAAINTASDAITREAALNQASLKLVKSEPIATEHVINSIVRKGDGTLEADYKDAAES